MIHSDGRLRQVLVGSELLNIKRHLQTIFVLMHKGSDVITYSNIRAVNKKQGRTIKGLLVINDGSIRFKLTSFESLQRKK